MMCVTQISLVALFRHDRPFMERATGLAQYLAPGAQEEAVALLQSNDMKEG